MTSIATVEFTIAIIMAISLIGQLAGRSELKSVRLMKMCMVCVIFWLIFDALSYTLAGMKQIFPLVYVINLLAYSFGSVVIISFVMYRDAFIREKTELNPWVYRIPTLVLGFCAGAIVIEYFQGNLVEYEDNVEVAVHGMPDYITIIEILVMLYLPIVSFSKRKSIGNKAVLLLACFDFIPILAGIASLLSEKDLSVIFGAVELMLVVSLLQKMNNKEQKQQREEEELRLQNARIAANVANEAKTKLLFNMSHDIRTPMNAILGFTGMAQKNLDNPEKVSDCLNKTQQAGNMLLALINSVLDMSRIESGNAEPQENCGDVYYSFSNIEAALREIASSADVKLDFEFGDIVNQFVYADFGRCTRIFTNLITNAIKYSKKGGYVRVRCEQYSPETDGYAKYKYTISDNGIGMSEEFQAHMFEAFTREQTSTTSGIQGTGLGLSVCKTFIEYLNGTIECDSRLGEGTVFTVILPFRVQKEDEYYTDPTTGDVVSNSMGVREKCTVDFTGKRVLLVEDNELNREIARSLLEEVGMQVDEVTDGVYAVELMKEKGQDEYDYVLMDIQMPRMNGYEATRIITEMYPNLKAPIIALSANAFEEDRKASQEAGMKEHIAKPINTEELFEAMGRY